MNVNLSILSRLFTDDLHGWWMVNHRLNELTSTKSRCTINVHIFKGVQPQNTQKTQHYHGIPILGLSILGLNTPHLPIVTCTEYVVTWHILYIVLLWHKDTIHDWCTMAWEAFCPLVSKGSYLTNWIDIDSGWVSWHPDSGWFLPHSLEGGQLIDIFCVRVTVHPSVKNWMFSKRATVPKIILYRWPILVSCFSLNLNSPDLLC